MLLALHEHRFHAGQRVGVAEAHGALFTKATSAEPRTEELVALIGASVRAIDDLEATERRVEAVDAALGPDLGGTPGLLLGARQLRLVDDEHLDAAADASKGGRRGRWPRGVRTLRRRLHDQRVTERRGAGVVVPLHSV